MTILNRTLVMVFILYRMYNIKLATGRVDTFTTCYRVSFQVMCKSECYMARRVRRVIINHEVENNETYMQ